ncbi:ERV/ALR sulfhydryl oxidase domain-containing protein [Lactifluus volemus]|nr:ERV/ALR sulfhydryl oxidase domain-containing protein [Lactifluus volemus]
MISRFGRFLLLVVVMFITSSVTLVYHPLSEYVDPRTGTSFDEGGVEKEFRALPIQVHDRPPASPHAMGSVIMPKLANETAKAALGRATWKLLHTMTLRYPEHPTEDEREALKSYFYLTSRLYPCGECAAEFQQLLELYPPQTSSRLSASSWLCFVHNQVNERLQKPIFDCAHLDKEYDCGCGDDGNSTDPGAVRDPSTIKDELTGAHLIKGGTE